MLLFGDINLWVHCQRTIYLYTLQILGLQKKLDPEIFQRIDESAYRTLDAVNRKILKGSVGAQFGAKDREQAAVNQAGFASVTNVRRIYTARERALCHVARHVRQVRIITRKHDVTRFYENRGVSLRLPRRPSPRMRAVRPRLGNRGRSLTIASTAVAAPRSDMAEIKILG